MSASVLSKPRRPTVQSSGRRQILQLARILPPRGDEQAAGTWLALNSAQGRRLGGGGKVEYGTANPASGFGDLLQKIYSLSFTSLLTPLSPSALSDFRLFRSQPSLLVLRTSLLSAMNPEAAGQPASVGGICKHAPGRKKMQLTGAQRVWGLGRNAVAQDHLCEKRARNNPKEYVIHSAGTPEKLNVSPVVTHCKSFLHLKQPLL